MKVGIKTLFELDRNDGEFFKAKEWRRLFFSNDGMAMVFENSHHHHRWFLAGSTIGSDGFSMVFPILGTNGSQWLQTEIRDKLRVNKDIKNRNASHQFIFLKCSTLSENLASFSDY